MLNDFLKKGIIQLLDPKTNEDVRRTIDPLYCWNHKMISQPLEKCVTVKERIMRLANDGIIILDLDDVIEIDHISCQINGLFVIQFGRLELVVLQEHGLPNPIMQERFVPISIFDKLTINMTSCSQVEEETEEEDDRQKNSLRQKDKSLDALKCMPVRSIWGKSLVCLTRSASIWLPP